MTSSNTNARTVDSGSTPGNDNNHAFSWKWKLSDLDSVPKNGLKVFSTFSCGGGSTMGYKLAGYEVIGNCEIDRDMNKLYTANHHPKHTYLMDIRDFEKLDNLPEELYDLDILDGSPPCSVFSIAGKREAGWGVEKQFREGQKKQRLDDLFFAYVDVVKKLRPKIAVAENVRGLVTAKAKGYVNEIFKAFREAGYEPQLFLLNAAQMGVPQARERVFFICRRKDLNLPKLVLHFNEPPIYFGQVRSKYGKKVKPGTKAFHLLQNRINTDDSFEKINYRLYGRKHLGFNHEIIADTRVAFTVTSAGCFYRGYDGDEYSKEDFIHVQTFPEDYDFMDQSPHYVCGMSVPPVMEAQIAKQIEKQWLKPQRGDAL